MLRKIKEKMQKRMENVKEELESIRRIIMMSTKVLNILALL